jgi:prepilin-type N-terminal cleavage/methylation domain-containing protein
MRDISPNPVRGYAGAFGRGFTLIEVLFAVVLVGMAIAGLTMSSFAYTQSNGAGADLATAEYLIEQIHEMTATMTVDAIYAYGGTGTGTRTTTISPSINANGVSLGTSFSAWKQQLIVEKLQKDLSTADTGTTPQFYRISVRSLKNNSTVATQSWIRARY